MVASSTESWSIDQGAGDVPGQWQRMLSDTHLPWATSITATVPGGVFEASARRWWIDDLALVDCECGPCSGTRQRHQLANTDDEFVVVLITRAGRETVSQAGMDAELRPGDAVAWDSTLRARFAVWEPLAERSLLIPRAALDEVGGRAWVRAGVALDGWAPATELLASYLDVLSRSLDRLGPAAVTAARNATLELFIGAVRGDAELATAGGTGPALRAAMDRYIERHLLDQPISAAALASAHGVSVRR